MGIPVKPKIETWILKDLCWQVPGPAGNDTLVDLHPRSALYMSLKTATKHYPTTFYHYNLVQNNTSCLCSTIQHYDTVMTSNDQGNRQQS